MAETDIPDLPTEITKQSDDFGRWYIDVVRRACHPSELMRDLGATSEGGRVPQREVLGRERGADQRGVAVATRQLVGLGEELAAAFAVVIEREMGGERRENPRSARISRSAKQRVPWLWTLAAARRRSA